MALPVARHLADGRVLGWTEVRKAHNANSACVQGKCKLETGAAERPGAAWKLVGDLQGPAVKRPGRKSGRLQPIVTRRSGPVSGSSRRPPAIAVFSFPSRHGERNTLAKPPIPAQGSVRSGLPPSIIRIWSSTEMFPTRRTFGEASGIPCNPAASWRRLRLRTWKRFA